MQVVVQMVTVNLGIVKVRARIYRFKLNKYNITI